MRTGNILTRPQSAGTSTGPLPGGADPFKRYTDVTVPSTATSLIDSIQYTTRASVKWIVCVSDPQTGKSQTYEITAKAALGKAPVYVKHSSIGDRISNVVQVTDTGMSTELRINNPNAYPIVIDVLRYDLVV